MSSEYLVLRWFRVALSLLLLLCSPVFAAIVANPSSLNLAPDAKATVHLQNVSGRLQMIISNNEVVEGSISGSTLNVHTKSIGNSVITVKDRRSTTSIAVNVSIEQTSENEGGSSESGGGSNTPPPSTGLSASPSSLVLIVGSKGSISVSNASGRIRVTVANSNVASTSLSGNTITVTAKAVGTTQITIRDQRRSITVPVSVSTAAPPMSANPTSLSLSVGQSGSVVVSNANGTLSFTLGSSSLVSASLSGTTLTVTGKTAGSTQVTVSDQRSSISIAITVTSSTPPPTTGGNFKLLAWNNLGMHCMDSDYSVFSILPPYNVISAQLIDTTNNKLITSGTTVTFEAMADPAGSINSISSTKTNFWQYAQPLYGTNLAPGVGLTGLGTASFTPQALMLDSAYSQFTAEGIPITPYDDAMQKNTYPMVKVVAKDAGGNKQAEAHVVLPVSDEMTCIACHGSNSGNAAKPAGGWVNDPNPDRDYRRNILKLHDEKQLGNSKYTSSLASKGYSASGLLATADSGKPILCAACHSTNALIGTGILGIMPLTEAIHAQHANVVDPKTGLALDNINNRNSCYLCHPGSETKCLRGVMGNTLMSDGSMAIQCQSCHGKMSNVGKAGRQGWFDEPNCQACHHDGARDLSAVNSSGVLKTVTDIRFATNSNTPSTGISLYRFSKGHGNLQCEACHGATHAEYPTSHPNDNILSKEVQGHEGTIAECAACHQTVPITATDGPHGMHTIGRAWISRHGNYAENNHTACAYCHGADYRGSPLSEVKVAKTLNGRSYTAGQSVTCYDCHNGPNGGD